MISPPENTQVPRPPKVGSFFGSREFPEKISGKSFEMEEKYDLFTRATSRQITIHVVLFDYPMGNITTLLSETEKKTILITTDATESLESLVKLWQLRFKS